MTIKPGIRTSELLAKVLVDIAATVLVVKGDITPDAWATIVGTTTSVYVAARTALKALATKKTAAIVQAAELAAATVLPPATQASTPSSSLGTVVVQS